ncbi:MAG: hypothetical protein AAGJ51_12370, partial [Pseudomonadota bacterium]
KLRSLWAGPMTKAILISTNFMSGVVPFPAIVALMSGAFIWMGLACLLNARRCRRRHCYYSGPIFLLGGIAVLLVGFEIISLGRDGLIIVAGATLTLALMTYLSEPVFGKYVR